MAKCICGHDRSRHKRGFPALAKCEYQKQVQGSGFFCDCGEYRVDEDDSPSGDALDRATQVLVSTGVSPAGRSELIEEIAKLIDAADASADTSADSAVIAAANARRRHRDAAKGIIDGCSDAGRGINGRSYWALIERVIKLLEEQERLRDELSRTAQQGGGEIDVLKQRIIDLERAQEARARRIRELAAQRDAAELENERLADRLNHAERSTTSLLQTMTTDQLVSEIRRRLNT